MSLYATSGTNAMHRAAKQKVDIMLRSSCVIPTAFTTAPSMASDTIAVRFIHDMTMLYVVPSAPSVHCLVVCMIIGSVKSMDAMDLKTPLAIAYSYGGAPIAMANANPAATTFIHMDIITAP